MAKTKKQEAFCLDKLEEDFDEDKTKSLLQLQVGEKGIIAQIKGGQGACKRLNELGLVPGVEIEIANKVTSGPVMIRVKGSKLALGRGLARKVEVLIEE